MRAHTLFNSPKTKRCILSTAYNVVDRMHASCYIYTTPWTYTDLRGHITNKSDPLCFTGKYMCLHASTRASMQVHVPPCKYMCLHASTCASMQVHVPPCKYMCLHASTRASMQVHVPPCKYTCLHASTCAVLHLQACCEQCSFPPLWLFPVQANEDTLSRYLNNKTPLDQLGSWTRIWCYRNFQRAPSTT